MTLTKKVKIINTQNETKKGNSDKECTLTDAPEAEYFLISVPLAECLLTGVLQQSNLFLVSHPT